MTQLKYETPFTLISSEAFPFNYKHGLWSTNDENRQFLYLFLRQLYSLEAFTIKTNVQHFFSHANTWRHQAFASKRDDVDEKRNENECRLQLCERAKIFVCAKKAKTKSKFSWTSFPHRMFFFSWYSAVLNATFIFSKFHFSDNSFFI